MLDGSTLFIATTVGVTSESELVSLWIRMYAHDPTSIMIRFKATWSDVHGCYGIGKGINYLIVSYLSILSVSINQRSAMRTRLGNTPPFFAYSCSISQGGSFGAKKMKIDRGNPKLEHGQRLVNDQTCLNK